MTYQAQELSDEAGQPIELFEFRLDTEVFRYTSNQVDFTVPVQVEYTAIPISRSEIVLGVGAKEQENITIQMPATNEFIVRYIQIAPGNPAEVKVERVHATDGVLETVEIFQGTIKNVSYVKDGLTAEVLVSSLLARAARSIPRFTYATQCNHILYDSQCGINFNDANFVHAGLVTAVSAAGDVITVTGAAAKNVLTDFFQAGLMSFNGEDRMITAQSGDNLTIMAPFATSPLASVVTARAGCQQRFQTDCIAKFANRERFGGFPYMPEKNPFEGLD